MIGLFPDVTFTTGERHVGDGDRLVLYTDGVTEALNDEGEEFGEERLIAAARGGASSAVGVQEAIVAAHTRFTADTPRSDDMTLLIARGR